MTYQIRQQPQTQAMMPYAAPQQNPYGGALLCYPAGSMGLRDDLTDEEVNKIIEDFSKTLPESVYLKAGAELFSGKFDTIKNDIVKPLMKQLCTSGVVKEVKSYAPYILYGVIGLAILLLAIKYLKNRED